MHLEAHNITYSYRPDTPVLHGIDLSVEPNQIVYLLGHNGSGKTTLLDVLSGTRSPDAGTVRLGDQDLHRLPARQRAQRVGMVPQMHTPVFAYTVQQVVMMGRTPYLRWFGSPGRHDTDIVDAALEAVGLIDLRDRPYTEISGGEQQLTLVARGLAQQTDFLLLDEPTAHLDPRNQALVLETVAQLAQASQGHVAFVISSHNPNSALLYAHKVVVMKGGRVVANGTPAEVLTEAILSDSYDMAVEVIYNEQHVAQAVMPRRTDAPRRNGNWHRVADSSR